MTLLELPVALDGFEMSQDGGAILIAGDYDADPRSERWAHVRAGIREHGRALIAMLPKASPDAPPKVRGPGGNVVDCKH
jgi:hypothetical protein